MKSVRIVFAGTPAFAMPALTAMLADPAAEVVAVYTQPDRPAGRGRRLSPSPIKRLAETRGLAVEQPASLSDGGVIERFAACRPDLLVVAAYGLMLPRAMLDIPAAAINVHASLLPRWRGAAPIQRAMIAGDAGTGISIMRIIERLDAGPVWLTRECTIDAGDTGGSLHDRLAELGAEALRTALDRYRRGEIRETPQDDAAATYAAKITARDRDIAWTQPAVTLARRIRALDPAPGARARLGTMEVKLFAAHAEGRDAGAAPGTVLDSRRTALRIATGEGVLAVSELQPPGGQRMSATAFINGYGSQL